MSTEEEAILTELQDISLYKREAARFDAILVDGERLGNLFRRFSEEEKVHYCALESIFPDAVKQSRPAEEIPLLESLRDSLRMHLERELAAIRIYEGMLKKVRAPLSALLIKGILADENAHLKAIIRAMRNPPID